MNIVQVFCLVDDSVQNCMRCFSFILCRCLSYCVRRPQSTPLVRSLMQCIIEESSGVFTQFEALCALKRRQEASEALDVLARQDRAFAKSKEYKLLLKQLQAM